MENKRTKVGKAPRQGPPLAKNSHNLYEDLQNKWSPNASTVDYSNLKLFLCTTLILLLIGAFGASVIWVKLVNYFYP